MCFWVEVYMFFVLHNFLWQKYDFLCICRPRKKDDRHSPTFPYPSWIVTSCRGGGTDIERGMCGPEDPLVTPLLQFTRVPFQAKESVHKTPFLRKCWDFSLYSLNFCPNFSSQAPKFGNFQLTSSQIWKISVHKISFKRQVSVCKPHTSEIWAAHPLIPYLKKKKKKKLSAPRASCHLLGEVSNSLSNTATIDNIQMKWIIPESNDSLSAYLLPTLLSLVQTGSLNSILAKSDYKNLIR